MANLKIKDETGKWVEIPVIKGTPGEKGNTGPTGPQGEPGTPGATGKSLEFNWDGTKLGVRQEGETEYQYTELGADIDIDISQITAITDDEIDAICILEE